MQNSQDKLILVSVLMLIGGFLILTSNYINSKIDNAFTYMNNLLLETNNLKDKENTNDIISTGEVLNNEKSVNTDPYDSYYIGNLIIPKINLNKGFVDINSKYNTVDKNIEIVKGSNYPNIDKGNFILASHSGNSYLSYFKNLYKLNIGDIAYINYQNIKYVYQIVSIYNVPKTGEVAIYRDINKKTLTLITCTKNSNDQQTIYILECLN